MANGTADNRGTINAGEVAVSHWLAKALMRPCNIMWQTVEGDTWRCPRSLAVGCLRPGREIGLRFFLVPMAGHAPKIQWAGRPLAALLIFRA